MEGKEKKVGQTLVVFVSGFIFLYLAATLLGASMILAVIASTIVLLGLYGAYRFKVVDKLFKKKEKPPFLDAEFKPEEPSNVVEKIEAEEVK